MDLFTVFLLAVAVSAIILERDHHDYRTFNRNCYLARTR